MTNDPNIPKKSVQPATADSKVPTTSPNKNLGGRPVIPIDETTVRKLARRLWSNNQIAAHFEVSHEVIYRRFGDIIKAEKEMGKAYLRDLQWKQAEKGDTKMIVHMSKHHLGEHDQQHLKVEKVSNEELAQLIQSRLMDDGVSLLPESDEQDVVGQADDASEDTEDGN